MGWISEPLMDAPVLPDGMAAAFMGCSPNREIVEPALGESYTDALEDAGKVWLRMLDRVCPVHSGSTARYERVEGTVRLSYQAADFSAGEFASWLKAHVPAEWDDIARYELVWMRRRRSYARALLEGSIKKSDLPPPYRFADENPHPAFVDAGARLMAKLAGHLAVTDRNRTVVVA